MGDPKGFLTTPRQAPARRPVDLRLKDWHEVYEEFPDDRLERQAGRCMNCGIPFCHQGCPLGNLIPEWNDLVYRDEWREAIERLHATNNFPEFTGTLCPAPCEAACVLAINSDAVERHFGETESAVAKELLTDWDDALHRFGKVMPKDFKRVLQARAAAERDGRDVNAAIMEAAHG